MLCRQDRPGSYHASLELKQSSCLGPPNVGVTGISDHIQLIFLIRLKICLFWFIN